MKMRVKIMCGVQLNTEVLLRCSGIDVRTIDRDLELIKPSIKVYKYILDISSAY